jgi:CubicO group peptidase (beta-lactamase class C family)
MVERCSGDCAVAKMVSLACWATSFVLMMQTLPVCRGHALRAVPAKTARSDGRDGIVDQIVQPFLQDGCHVGLSVVIVRRKEAWFYHFGSTSRATHTTPTSESLYEIPSVTKTFTGVWAAKALLEHHLQLDADFRQYLPPYSHYPRDVGDRDNYGAWAAPSTCQEI